MEKHFVFFFQKNKLNRNRQQQARHYHCAFSIWRTFCTKISVLQMNIWWFSFFSLPRSKCWSIFKYSELPLHNFSLRRNNEFVQKHWCAIRAHNLFIVTYCEAINLRNCADEKETCTNCTITCNVYTWAGSNWYNSSRASFFSGCSVLTHCFNVIQQFFSYFFHAKQSERASERKKGNKTELWKKGQKKWNAF